MNKHNAETIRKELIKIFDLKSELGKFSDEKLNITVEKDLVHVTIKRVYSHVDYGVDEILALVEFFGTRNIKDDRYSVDGCETCDYGSSYTLNLTIRPNKPK